MASWRRDVNDAISDVKHAVRGLLRTRGFVAVVLLTVALGIGVNTAIFSIVNSVVLRPLAYPKPDQLMYLTTRLRAWRASRLDPLLAIRDE
jgi:hypothetical protein